MYSGSGNNDSTESSNYAQWPMLNPAMFQNTPNEQVDWAALAQQWIQMKEAGPPLPPTTPTPEHVLQTQPVELKKKTETYWKSPNWNSGGGGNEWNSKWKPTLLPTPSKNYTNSSDATPGASTRHYKPHNKRYSKVNVPKVHSVENQTILTEIPSSDTPQIGNSLDANKRKQLPAWIREGLEKMERDKLKLIEKEKEKEQAYLYTEQIKVKEKETMEILKSTIEERRKIEPDNDDDDDVTEREQFVQVLSRDELMLSVRRTMTEILLKVTNASIQQICNEERQRAITKTVKTGNYLTTVKLGLGMYGSDSGESDTSVETPTRHNSEDELKSIIKKRKADFIETERGIETKLQKAKKDKLKVTNCNASTPETNLKKNSTTHRSRDSSNSSTSTSSSSSSDYNHRRRRRRRKSTSSNNSSSSNQKGGYTPEKKPNSKSYERKKITKKRSTSRIKSSKRSVSRSRSRRSRSSSYRTKRSSRKRTSKSPSYYSRNSRRSRSRSSYNNKSSRIR